MPAVASTPRGLSLGPDPAMPVREGDVLLGKYRVGGLIGVGGMSVVLSATHLGLDEQVALKFLRSTSLGSADARERFASEARAAVRIKSEYVARIIDVAATDSGVPFIVMERLEGRDLAELVLSSGPIGFATAAAWVIQICSALAEAHERGIVHRDLKPANLFLTRRSDGSDCIKVLDFGISKILAADGRSQGRTGTRSLLGSPVYMAPEQMSSAKTVDARADIWALGVVLFELLTGTAPFDAPTLPEVCVRVLQDPPMRPRALCPELPADFEAIVLRCLEKDRERRFQTVIVLAHALSAFAPTSLVPDVRPVRVPTVEMLSGIAPRDGGALASTRVAPRRSRSMLVAAGGVLALGGALSVLTLAGRTRDSGRPLDALEAAAIAAPAPALPVGVVATPTAGAPTPASSPSAIRPRPRAPLRRPLLDGHLFDERK